MRKMYLLPVFLGALCYGQVGINSVTPVSTLDVTSKTTDGSTAEGLALPRVTGNALKAAETAGVYGANQNSVLVFVTVEPDPANRTGQVEGMDAPGFYYFDAGSNRWVKMISSGATTAAVTQLSCSTPINVGSLEAGDPAAGVSISIPYTGGNGGFYSGMSIASVGVTGLTATLSSGTLNNGSGNLVFDISGTPSTDGTATFDISFGGINCGFIRTVDPASGFADVVDVIINGQTVQMMTRNLGADTSLDPNIVVKGIHGNYYQWGKRNAVADANTPATAPAGWSTAAAANGAWNTGTEAVPNKTVNDPCPTGFRVPTRNEWVSFNTNSTTSNMGTFVASPGSATNFTVAKVFTNNGSTLTFPTAGYRNAASGELNYRAYNGFYWSSTENSTNAYHLGFGSGAVNPANNYYRPTGFSVRCISQ
ncbi:FISUMP domain-containing protein [Chryseobacterium sp. CBSDS_008]|uniref:FISUMP domain-containing protein n=1 Tax=Chryseobacterium sp. CBSDS_008 TaxID=3415265 RepID=UPI003CF4EC93